MAADTDIVTGRSVRLTWIYIYRPIQQQQSPLCLLSGVGGQRSRPLPDLEIQRRRGAGLPGRPAATDRLESAWTPPGRVQIVVLLPGTNSLSDNLTPVLQKEEEVPHTAG